MSALIFGSASNDLSGDVSKYQTNGAWEGSANTSRGVQLQLNGSTLVGGSRKRKRTHRKKGRSINRKKSYRKKSCGCKRIMLW